MNAVIKAKQLILWCILPLAVSCSYAADETWSFEQLQAATHNAAGIHTKDSDDNSAANSATPVSPMATPATHEVSAINQALYSLVNKTSGTNAQSKISNNDSTPLPNYDSHASGVNLWNVVINHFGLNQNASSPEVRHQVLWLLSHRAILDKMLQNSEPYLYYVYQQTQMRHMPAEFALLPMVESCYSPYDYSSAGATGLWQMEPGTASSFGLNINWWYDSRRDTVVATQAALNYLARLHDDAFHDWYLTAAAYDAGIGTVQAAQQYNQRAGRGTDFWSLPLPEETRDYVPKLLALATIVQNAKTYGITLPFIPDSPYFAQINLNSQMDIGEIANLSGVDSKIIQKLNPGLRRWATDPDNVYTLLLPNSAAQKFRNNLARVTGHAHTTWQYHEVGRHETLESIAHIYHTNVDLLEQVNQLADDNTVAPGVGLLVPLHINNTFSAPVAIATTTPSIPAPAAQDPQLSAPLNTMPAVAPTSPAPITSAPTNLTMPPATITPNVAATAATSTQPANLANTLAKIYGH